MKQSLIDKLSDLADRFEEVGALLSDPETIGDQPRFRELSREYARLEPVVADFRNWRTLHDDLAAAREMQEDDDPSVRAMGQEEAAQLEASREGLELNLRKHLIPRDPRDESNIYLEIRAGTGGDEAALFAGDLFRMYGRYAESQGWTVEILSASEGEHGGYKEVISRVEGRGAYSRLKFESGAHRVQRVPETESQGRIHTSACTVAVLPEVEAVEDVEINNADLRVDTYRASGAGGQHVNKTDSAIRITHIPTGIVVACQSQRSQHKNRSAAMKELKSRLYELELSKKEEEAESLAGEKKEIGWGSQIRSYVLHPYRMVKDHRTGHEVGNADAVLDGDIDGFIEAYLLSKA